MLSDSGRGVPNAMTITKESKTCTFENYFEWAHFKRLFSFQFDAINFAVCNLFATISNLYRRLDELKYHPSRIKCYLKGDKSPALKHFFTFLVNGSQIPE